MSGSGTTFYREQEGPKDSEVKQPEDGADYRADSPTTYTTTPAEDEGIPPGNQGWTNNPHRDSMNPPSSTVIPTQMKETLREQVTYVNTASAARVASRYAGLWDAPPRMVEDIQSWVLRAFATYVLGSMAARGIDAPEVQKAAQKLTRRGKVYKGKLSKKFPVDLEGWRRGKDIGDEDAADYALEEGDLVLVNMEFDRPGPAGEWEDKDGWGGLHGKLQVNATEPVYDVLQNPSLSQWRNAVGFLKETVRHEMEHFAQAFFRDYLTWSEGIDALPGSRGDREWAHTRRRDISSQVLDNLKSFEFYPRLRDEISGFLRGLEQEPAEEWKPRLRDWIRTRDFMKDLQRHDPPRWRKAVGEFYAAVDEALGRTASVRVAATMADISGKTGPLVHQRSQGLQVNRKRFSPTRGFWTFTVIGAKGTPYTVRLKGIRKTKAMVNLSKAQVKCSCSCPFWRWQGPEHWGKQNGFLYGRPRGTASKPVIRDPKEKHWACKHILAALRTAQSYRFSSEEAAWSLDGELVPMPDPGRVAARFRRSPRAWAKWPATSLRLHLDPNLLELRRVGDRVEGTWSGYVTTTKQRDIGQSIQNPKDKTSFKSLVLNRIREDLPTDDLSGQAERLIRKGYTAILEELDLLRWGWAMGSPEVAVRTYRNEKRVLDLGKGEFMWPVVVEFEAPLTQG
jgi:hypothetical protein